MSENARNFKIQEGLVRGFRDFLMSRGFTEIHTPKLGAKSAERAVQTSSNWSISTDRRSPQQSPQLCKQMMVGVFDGYLRQDRCSCKRNTTQNVT